ncbi:hypothetical protein B0H17DRAFT_232018 [Mycena rosella]|uniref:Uncharacterized protein n=1 Tax=Mycena rosella TaxID=1033263 RepID=A0AAD7H195_MYCRO|nr:hypothetical protein B0H17DRAFT_232018 [Mycena rosella]
MESESLVRTATHYYPRPEICAMYAVYGGPPPTCAVTGASDATVPYSHQMPVGTSSSTERLNVMLERKLRIPRNEAHAGELRENIFPLISTVHQRADALLPTSTLFPCKKDLIKALAYEREVKALRLQWARSGRGDPGRPAYAVGYPLVDDSNAASPRPDHMSAWGPILSHRLHSTGKFAAIRYSDGSQIPQMYQAASMPGDPDATDRFPIIKTLLSIPFSVLHNTSRLQSLFPKTLYQHALIEIANELIYLWSWDPDSTEFPDGIAVTTDTPSWPPPIYHQSRTGTTYLPSSSYIIPPPAASTPTTTLANGQVWVSSLPPTIEYSDGQLVAAPPPSFDSRSAKFSMAFFSCPSEVETDLLDFDMVDESTDEERSQPTSLSYEEVSRWVCHSEEFQPEEWAPLAKTPFEPGLHGDFTGDRAPMIYSCSTALSICGITPISTTCPYFRDVSGPFIGSLFNFSIVCLVSIEPAHVFCLLIQLT